MAHFAGGHNLVLDLGGQLDGDGERHALVAARAAVDLRVDAHHLATGVEQRAAGVARVHRHVGLDEGHQAVVGQRAALGTDHAGGHAVFKAKGRANGQNPFAYLQVAGAAQAHGGQVLGVDLEHGHVGLGVRAQHLGAELAPVGELDDDFAGTLDHMRVGQHQAIGADDKARALAVRGYVGLGLWPHAARKAELAEELVERIVGVHLRCPALARGGLAFVFTVVIGHGGLGAARHADVDHCRAVLRSDLSEAGQGPAGGGGRLGHDGGGRGQGAGLVPGDETCARGTHRTGGHQGQDEAAGGGGQRCRVHGVVPFQSELRWRAVWAPTLRRNLEAVQSPFLLF